MANKQNDNKDNKAVSTSARSAEESDAIRRAKKAAQKANTGKGGNALRSNPNVNKVAEIDKARFVRRQRIRDAHVEQCLVAATFVWRASKDRPQIVYTEIDAHNPLRAAIDRFFAIYADAVRDPKTARGPLKVAEFNARHDKEMKLISVIDPNAVETAIRFCKTALFWASQQDQGRSTAPAANTAS